MRKSAVAGIPGGAAAAIEEPSMEPGGAESKTAPAVAAAPADVGPSRLAGSLPVQVAALPGPGGLGAEVSAEAGSLSRRAQYESTVVHTGTARFLNRKVGGPLAIDGHAREPAEAFSTRGGQRTGKSGGLGQPSEKTEASVELGLDFLARHQSSNSSWSLNDFGAGQPGYENEQAVFRSDTAATGLARRG